MHHVTRHNTPIRNILSTVPQLRISQKALRTLPELLLLVFHAYINEMHCSRSKIPSTKSRPYTYVKFLALLGATYIYIYIYMTLVG
jgi:hypothetical protein